MQTVSLADKFSLFSDYWSPKIAAELNDSYVKARKAQGGVRLASPRERGRAFSGD